MFFPGSEVSVREESDTDPNQSDEAEAETSPTKSPTTPKSVKCKNSSGKVCAETNLAPALFAQLQSLFGPDSPLSSTGVNQETFH